ncbi:MAG: SDR family oxidoreductase [Betaproteobacteria bacterium]|nr:SDR family oxidoreductase [Betaproteobacteria bacterium]
MKGGKRIAVITGGAKGIGLAIALRLVRDNVIPVLADIDGELAHKAAAELCAAGLEAVALRLDVTDEGSVTAVLAEVDQRFGSLDILVNNAGIIGLDGGRRPLIEGMSLQLWQRTLDVNLTGAFLMSRGAIPLMRRGRWGRIVNMSSRTARTRTGPGNAHYAASKAGMIGFSRVLASEVGKDGITVNCVAPSKIATAMTMAIGGGRDLLEKNIAETAVGRLGEPADVANAVAYLCSDQANFITGIVIDVTGGSFMP